MYEFLVRGDFIRELGAENIFADKYDSLTSIFERLNKKTCDNHPAQVFLECHIHARNNLKNARLLANAASAAT